MNQNIHIFNPSKSTGGTNNLLYNLTLLLYDSSNFNLTYVDYFDSPIVALLKNNNIDVKIVYLGTDKINVNDSVIITILLKFKVLHEFFKYTTKTKAIFWSTHPDDGMKLLSTFNIWYSLNPILSRRIANILHYKRKKKLSKLLDIGQKKNGLVWMDLVNYNKNYNFYGLKNKPIIWPLITKEPSIDLVVNKSNKFKILILGRLVNFKVFPLHGLIQQIADHLKSSSSQISIDFVGDGPYKWLLEKWLKNQNIIEYNFIGNVNLDKLDAYIVQYDLLVGMATSVLEGAKLKIPSAIINYSYEILNSNQVELKLLYDVEPYYIGSKFISDKKKINFSFSNLFEQVRKDKILIGEKCYDHWLKYHSPKSFEQKVFNTIQKNNMFLIHNKKKILKTNIFDVVINKIKKQING